MAAVQAGSPPITNLPGYRLSGIQYSLTMDYLQCYVDFWKNFINFNGRATRTMFWVPTGINFAVSMFFFLLNFIIPLVPFVLQILWCLAIIIPSLSLLARRLHDTNRGTMQLLWLLLPFFGALYLFVVAGFMQGNPYDNEFGCDPHLPAPQMGY